MQKILMILAGLSLSGSVLVAPLTPDFNGGFYGSTSNGGPLQAGTVFRLVP